MDYHQSSALVIPQLGKTFLYIQLLKKMFSYFFLKWKKVIGRIVVTTMPSGSCSIMVERWLSVLNYSFEARNQLTNTTFHVPMIFFINKVFPVPWYVRTLWIVCSISSSYFSSCVLKALYLAGAKYILKSMALQGQLVNNLLLFLNRHLLLSICTKQIPNSDFNNLVLWENILNVSSLFYTQKSGGQNVRQSEVVSKRAAWIRIWLVYFITASETAI